MPDLFLSYCRDDRLVMHVLRDNLRRLGFNVWIDEEHLTVGTPEWQQAIEEAIEHAGAMVVLLSPGAKASHWVNNEILCAQACRKRIFPVLIAGDNRSAVPLSLKTVQHADMRGRASYEDEFRKLVKGLAAHFGMTVAEFHLDFSGAHIQVNVYGNVEGGKILVAGRDVVEQTVAAPHAPPPPEAELPPPEEPAPEATPTTVNILDILPAPFEWCEIPAGRVEIEGQSFDVQPFFMAKYPATYEQFQVFIDAEDGFYNDEWWQGLAKRESQPGSQRFTHAENLPRENVSWYDAVAFCRWLTSKVDYEVRLPTEWEWQWAAQGPDGLLYPWGPEYIQGYANIDEKNSGVKGGVYLEKTTPVGSYPNGASPYGVLDMSGNVWEWCLNEYDNPGQIDTTGDALRVVHGGSWDNHDNYARATYRYKVWPDSRYRSRGFRVMGFDPVLSQL
jgi:hypothetical protein